MRAPQARLLAVSHQPALWNDLRLTGEPQGLAMLTAQDAESALECVRTQLPDLVLVDLDLPGTDGFALLAQLRRISLAGIIAVSTQADERPKIRALEMGADDYVTRPFSATELIARIDAILRRARASQGLSNASLIVDERLRIDFATQQVSVADQPVALRPTEYRLLYHLVQHAGHTLSFADILARVWGPEYSEEVHYVHLYVMYLRHKIEIDPSNPRYILSKRGVGYSFCALPSRQAGM
ncbi:MAG TPA: response regulator transcription factor [Chloroflexota bacterium]|nr:response regulator transcription factor [Chloroflexota bacterium]